MDWISNFAGLSTLEPSIKEILHSRSRIVVVPKDAQVFGPGKQPDHLLMLISGTVRVQQRADTGRTIVLYRINAGESCVLTTACLLSHEVYSAEGVAETDVRAVAIPRSVFEELIATSKNFRDFVFSAYARRITDLFYVIDELAFRKIDVRLAHKLLELTDKNDQIDATHQQLAEELGTAREVVSRQLQDFQKRGFLEQSRGKVRLKKTADLQKIASSS